MSEIIPNSEITNRWKGVKSELDQKQLDALIVPLGVNFYYLFGKQGLPSERLIAGIIPRDSDPFIISPSFEKSNVERATGLDDIITWEETESPYDKLAKDLVDRGIGKNIGVDPKLWLVEVERLEKSLKTSSRSIVSADSILNKLRSSKSEWELQQMRKAAEFSAEGILAAIPQLQVGTSEIDFVKVVTDEMSNLSNGPTSFGLVQFGDNSAIPHGMPSKKKLSPDSSVLIDAGTSINGYHGDITITVPFGKPKDFAEIYDIVFDANRKALDADREGFVPSELDAIARDHIKSKGYGKYFPHRLGHGLGLEVHETPYIVATNQIPLVKGNTHTIEPGIYIPGKYGIRIEDDVFVDKGKAHLLYETPRHNF
jgi:Xaa-Pro dipeptidase